MSSYSPSGTKAQSRQATYISRKSKSNLDDRSLRRKSTNQARAKEEVEDEIEVANGLVELMA